MSPWEGDLLGLGVGSPIGKLCMLRLRRCRKLPPNHDKASGKVLQSAFHLSVLCNLELISLIM